MKKKYSTLLNFALAACVATSLAACSDGDFTGSTGESHNNPKVSIGGIVQDTNGNLLADVDVSCQGMTTRTNALGDWVINNLRTTNTAGTADDTAQASPIVCSIGAPAGYLGATVTVEPESQVSSPTYDFTESDLAITNPRTIWIDGYYAQAGTAVLPMLGSTVKGRLENCNTEEGYSGVDVRLDMHGVNEAHQQPGHDSNSLSYSTALYAATTDANGNFTISNVPNDSDLNLYVPEWNTDIEANSEGYIWINTENEGIVALGDVCVDPISTGDGQRPCVQGVTDYVHGWDPDSTGSFGQSWDSTQSLNGGFILWAVLNDDVDGTGDGFSIMFNETMQNNPLDGNSVIIWNEGPDTLDPTDDEYVTDFSATVSGNALTIVTAAPLGDDDHLKIYLLLDDLQDTAGNYLATEDMLEDDGLCDNTPGSYNLPWVNDFISNNNTLYAVLGVKIFSPDSTNVGEVSDLAQVCLADGGNAGMPILNAEYPEVFTDMNSGNAMSTFDNLNADDDFWEERLEALADAQGHGAAVVNNHTALVTFVTPSEGSYSVSPGSCSGSNVGTTESCVVTGVSVGDTVSVTSEDDFGNPSNVVSIVLGDCAAPTTVLNYAYNTCGHVGYDLAGTGFGSNHIDTDSDTNYAAHICTFGEIAGDPAYGDGGENTDESEESFLGIPTLNITCRLLKDAADAPGVVEPIDFFGLYGQIDTYPADDVPNLNNELYDATAFAGWQPFVDTIGVAFSENIRMTEGGTLGWSGVTNIDSWTIGNNISQQDDSEGIDANPYGGNVDLAQITVADVLTLANDDHGEIMNFSNAVEDIAGNAADNARVVVNDLLPPFVTSAYWDGNMVITFNEPVNVCTDPADDCTPTTVTLLDPTYGGSGGAYVAGDAVLITNGATLSPDGMTLTIPSATIAASAFDRGQHFPGLATTGALVYDESVYDSIITSPLADYAHGRLNFDNIEDMNGNSWDDWDGGDFLGINGQVLCNTPEFAAVDALGPFIITSIPITMEPTDVIGRFNVVYTFSLPIDYAFTFTGTPDCSTIATNNATCANTWLQTAGNLAGVSTLSYAGATATTGSTYNDLTRTLTLVFDGSGNWVTGDSIAFSTGWRWISAFGGNSRTLNDHVIE